MVIDLTNASVRWANWPMDHKWPPGQAVIYVWYD